MRLRMALVDRKLVADSTLVDTMILSSCDYLILGLQSGYSRLALALAAAGAAKEPCSWKKEPYKRALLTATVHC